jgi:hypothetical protein
LLRPYQPSINYQHHHTKLNSLPFWLSAEC